MAKVLKKYEPTARPGPPAKYPWDEWLDGKRIWQLTAGDDFTCSVSSMIDQIRHHADERGVAVSVHKEGVDSLVIVPR